MRVTVFICGPKSRMSRNDNPGVEGFALRIKLKIVVMRKRKYHEKNRGVFTDAKALRLLPKWVSTYSHLSLHFASVNI